MLCESHSIIPSDRGFCRIQQPLALFDERVHRAVPRLGDFLGLLLGRFLAHVQPLGHDVHDAPGQQGHARRDQIMLPAVQLKDQGKQHHHRPDGQAGDHECLGIVVFLHHLLYFLYIMPNNTYGKFYPEFVLQG